MVHQAGLTPDVPSLLAFFRQHTLTPDDMRRIEALVRQLGDDVFGRREEAARELVRRGEPAAPFLQKALRDPDAEVARRASLCLEEIVALRKSPALPGAAARLLARRGAPGTAATLLAYLPFAEEASLEEILEALALLAGGPGSVEAPLQAALADFLPVRRAAAARALGSSRDPAVRGTVVPLLLDKDPAVRFQAAVGLLSGGDKKAVPALIALLTDGPPDLADLAEGRLQCLAGDAYPSPPAGDDAGGKKRRAAWEEWWIQQGPRLDLSRTSSSPRYLGLTLVPEMHANKVWECGKDGKPLW
jgi:HEAT repeat protein